MALPACTCGCPEASHMGLPRGCMTHGFHEYKADMSKSVSAKQVGGDHYKGELQPIDVIDSWKLDFYEGSVLKYLARHRKKNGAEDIKKAIHYLELLLERQYPDGQA